VGRLSRYFRRVPTPRRELHSQNRRPPVGRGQMHVSEVLEALKKKKKRCVQIFAKANPLGSPESSHDLEPHTRSSQARRIQIILFAQVNFQSWRSRPVLSRKLIPSSDFGTGTLYCLLFGVPPRDPPHRIDPVDPKRSDYYHRSL
jgi:hypothetical protein